VAATDAAPFDRTIGPDNGERFAYCDLEGMSEAIESCLAGSRETRAAVERYDVERTLSHLESLYRGARSSAEVPTASDDEWGFGGEPREFGD
ncbi:glycosyltransferase family 4 protein, partial [Natronococcus sp. JC468]|nr:glycosyltransferase family 4 protein [Natronococcus sp. JC468]